MTGDGNGETADAVRIVGSPQGEFAQPIMLFDQVDQENGTRFLRTPGAANTWGIDPRR